MMPISYLRTRLTHSLNPRFFLSLKLSIEFLFWNKSFTGIVLIGLHVQSKLDKITVNEAKKKTRQQYVQYELYVYMAKFLYRNSTFLSISIITFF